MSTNSYFKVGNDVRRTFFFDRRSKSSAASAWTLALTSAQMLLEGQGRKETSPEVVVSVWERPTDSGPWDAASLIGERSKDARGPVDPD